MQKDSTKQKALDFLDWMDTHYEDWVSVSCSIDTCELSDADTIHILNKAYENGLVELFFAYFMNVREARAIEETRDRYFIQLLKKEVERDGLEGVFYPFKKQLQIRT